jgi:hypothetical protein
MRHIVFLLCLVVELAAGSGKSNAGDPGNAAGQGLRSPPAPSQPFEMSKIVPSAVTDENARTDDWFERSYRACVAAVTISDLSVDGASRPPPSNSQIDYVRNKLSLTQSGRALWNGIPVDLVTLRQYLELTSVMTPKPFLIVETQQGAPDSFVRAVHGTVVRSGVCPSLPIGAGD